MSLPACQERILSGIENALRACEPRLASRFAIFTRLTRDEEIPRTEQLVPQTWLRHALTSRDQLVRRDGSTWGAVRFAEGSGRRVWRGNVRVGSFEVIDGVGSDLLRHLPKGKHTLTIVYRGDQQVPTRTTVPVTVS